MPLIVVTKLNYYFIMQTRRISLIQPEPKPVLAFAGGKKMKEVMTETVNSLEAQDLDVAKENLVRVEEVH